MKNQINHCLSVVVFCISVIGSTLWGQQPNAESVEKASKASTIAIPLFGQDLNDPRIPTYKAAAEKPYTGRTTIGIARDWVASIFYGDTVQDVQDSYTIEYLRHSPLVGRVIKGFEISSIDSQVSKKVSLIGCKAYREDISSPWLLDYMSLNHVQIQEIRQMRGLK